MCLMLFPPQPNCENKIRVQFFKELALCLERERWCRLEDEVRHGEIRYLTKPDLQGDQEKKSLHVEN